MKPDHIQLLSNDEKEDFTFALLKAEDLKTSITLLNPSSDYFHSSDRMLPTINRVVDLNAAPRSWSVFSRFLLEHKHLLGSPGPLSLASRAGGMPQQWLWMNENFPSIKTLNYYFGGRAEMPSPFLGSDFFFSDPDCLYYWGNGEPPHPQWKHSMYPFIVEKPRGVPVVVTVCLGEVKASRLDGKELESKERLQLEEVSLACAEVWQAQVSECLFFREEEILTFAMHSPALKISVRLSGFEEFIQNSFRQWKNHVAS